MTQIWQLPHAHMHWHDGTLGIITELFIAFKESVHYNSKKGMADAFFLLIPLKAHARPTLRHAT
jgi:hypothetical protein